MKLRLRNSLFARLAVLALAVMIIAVGATSLIALDVLSNAVADKQRDIEQQAAMKLRGYLEEKYRRISVLMDDSSTRVQLGARLARIARDEQIAYNYDYIESLLEFANNVLLLDSDFQDCILIANGGMVYSQTRVQSGDAVASYDYLNDPAFAEFLNSGALFGMVHDDPDRYTIHSSGEVLSLLWCLVDPAKLPEQERVGFMIVNLPVPSVDSAFADFATAIEGNLLLVDADGETIYDAHQFGPDVATAAPIVYPLSLRGGYAVHSVLPANLIADEREALLRKTLIVFMLAAGVSSLMMAVVVYTYNRRSEQLIATMRRVQEGHLHERAKVTRRDEIGELSAAFNVMAEQLEQYIDRTYAAELSRRDSEMALLQSQINPHFLYNALENMSMLAARQGCDDVADLAADLGHLFRISIRSKDLIVSIDSELEYVKLYMSIQAARFGEDLRFEVEAEPALRACAIPKLILQPLVENAVIHGHHALKPGAFIRVEVARAAQPGMLRVSVRDNGEGIPTDRIDEVMTQRKSIGLPNTAQRIRLLFGEACALRVDSVPGEGTCISFLMPEMSVEEMKAYVQVADRG